MNNAVGGRGLYYKTTKEMYIALPLTSSIKKSHQPTHVLLRADETGLKKDSMVLCENPERMSKERIGNYITSLTCDQMSLVAEGFLLATSVIAFINKEDLMDVYGRAVTLNAT